MSNFGLMPFQTKKAFANEFSRLSRDERAQKVDEAILDAESNRDGKTAWFGGEVYTLAELRKLRASV